MIDQSASQMVQERYQIPLSPPNSPRMSDAATKPGDYPYQRVTQHQHSQTSTSYQEQQSSSRDQQSRPSLPSFNDFTYSQNLQGRRGLDDGKAYPHSIAASGWSPSHDLGSHFASSARVRTTSTNESMPASPADRLTPRSPASASKEFPGDDDLVESGGEEQEDDSDKLPLTAEQLRAQKKKNKRFRLSHSQTRYLMAEFARQAHPDAAHRERLAREIPGLSARQVQVWFQNRRAKLKRLTTDDREHMLRSRQLPADFDTTQALHAPFGAPANSMGGHVSSLRGYQTYGEPSAVQPLTLNTLRQVPDYERFGQQYTSPTGVSPAMSAFAFTPPQPEHLSPGSATSGISSYGLSQPASFDSSRRYQGGLPMSSHTGYSAQSQLQRLPLHERLNRNVGDATGSPLRSSLSYANLASSSHPTSAPSRVASFSEHAYGQQRPHPHSTSSAGAGEPGPYGLGFSYSQPPSYQHSEQHPQTSIPGDIQSSTDQEQYKRHSEPSAYGPYQSPGFGTHVPYHSGYFTPYSQSYHSSYAQQGQVTDAPSQTDHYNSSNYQAVSGAPQPYMPLHSSNGNQVTDSHSGSMPPSY